MYSVVVGDKVFDVKYKRYSDHGYSVHLGEKCLGIIFKPMQYSVGWDVTVHHKFKANFVRGFISREKAMEFLLKDLGYHYDESNDITEYVVFKTNMEFSQSLMKWENNPWNF